MRFFQELDSNTDNRRQAAGFVLAGQICWAFAAILSFYGDNRFMPKIALHYAESHRRWANTTKCD
jgi:hypothetical protein